MFFFPFIAVITLFVLGLVAFFRKIGLPAAIRIAVSFAVVGILASVITVWVWPKDVAVEINTFGVLLGDYLYRWSIDALGDPSSPQAHFTIPWLLRVPQVYVVSSLLFWGLFGLVIQIFFNLAGKIGYRR